MNYLVVTLQNNYLFYIGIKNTHFIFFRYFLLLKDNYSIDVH